MTSLRQKLNSQRGASILLAMLLFLVCCMVAASVLAAAVSNAGKGHSVEAEQQKYLTLSSALQLVTAELEQARYQGKYKVYEWTVTDDSDPDDPISYYYFHCEQLAGAYSCGDLTDQIPLGKELDKIFSKQFTGTGYSLQTGLELKDQQEHRLTVSLPDTLPGYSGSQAYDDAKTVTVQVELSHSTGHITLTAWTGDGAAPSADETMVAELIAVNNTLPLLDYAPGFRTANSPPSGSGTEKTITRVTKWALNSIRKGGS